MTIAYVDVASKDQSGTLVIHVRQTNWSRVLSRDMRPIPFTCENTGWTRKSGTVVNAILLRVNYCTHRAYSLCSMRTHVEFGILDIERILKRPSFKDRQKRTVDVTCEFRLPGLQPSTAWRKMHTCLWRSGLRTECWLSVQRTIIDLCHRASWRHRRCRRRHKWTDWTFSSFALHGPRNAMSWHSVRFSSVQFASFSIKKTETISFCPRVVFSQRPDLEDYITGANLMAR